MPIVPKSFNVELSFGEVIMLIELVEDMYEVLVEDQSDAGGQIARLSMSDDKMLSRALAVLTNELEENGRTMKQLKDVWDKLKNIADQYLKKGS